jgi:outer membrane protein
MLRLAGVLFFLGMAGWARSQVHFTSLQEILQYADKNSLVTQQSIIQNGISQKEESINKSGLLPKINVFGTTEYDPLIPVLVVPASLVGGPPGKFEQVRLGLPWINTAGIELTLPVINFEKWEQLKRYKLQSLQTSWDTKVNLESLHIQVTQSYYQAILTKELVNINKSNQEITDELLRILEERKKNGLLDPADYNRSKYLQLDMLNEGIEYEKNYGQALIVLKQLLNIPDSAFLELNDSLSVTDWMLVPQAISIVNRPAWKEAEARIAVAEQQVKESQKAALPAISLDGKYTHESQIQPSDGQHINYDLSSIGLRLDFPLFQGNYYKVNKQKNVLQLELAKLSKKQTENDLFRQQSEWRNDYEAALKKEGLLKQKLDLASENLRIGRINIKEGLMEFDEFNNLFQDYTRIRMDYLQNLNDGIVYKILLTQKW